MERAAAGTQAPGAGHAWGLAAILLVAAAVRALAWSRTTVLFNDGPIFLALAEAISEGRFAEALAHPYHLFYPALVALVARGPVGLESAAVAVSIAGGLLSVAAIFYGLREAFDRRTAWLAAWAMALHPWAVDFSSDVMSDGLYAGLYLTGFAALVSALARPRVSAALLCGSATGLAYLTRPEGLVLLAVASGLLGLRAWLDGRERRRVGLVALACATTGAGVVIPFVLAVASHTGDLALSQKKSLASLAAPPTSEAERLRERRARREALEAVGSLPIPESAIRSDGRGERHPSRSPGGVLETVWRVLTTSLAALRFEVAAFVALGLWATRGRWQPWREAAIGLPVVIHSALLMLLVWGAGYVSRRHALPVWLPALGFAAVGWKTSWELLAGRLGSRPGAPGRSAASANAACLALVLILAVIWLPRDARVRRAERAPVRAAAEWLAAREGAGVAPVAAQKLRVAYYAGAEFVPLPSGLDGTLERQLRRRGARWVIIDRAKLEDHLGLFEGLESWLSAVHEERSAGRTALVLEIRPEPAR